ncbi:Gag protease polyprotein [Gossypium australe]|uniref:Gag protease polyprotein n=1 Tax=Gossypium australe TaxID=47621 RepID=A0A5B6WH08_9ROSI|nr:Gag protease polyprotein [Gossypium australe]
MEMGVHNDRFCDRATVVSEQKNAIWVILAHFLVVGTHWSFPKLADVYIPEIVRLHGTKLNFILTFHLQTDGQSKQVIQILEDMFRACIIHFEVGWEHYVTPLTLSSQAFKWLYMKHYSQRCRTPDC